jgi:pantoate kinase
MTVSHVRRARAFAPGHVTGVFQPNLESRDPRGRGSVGAGVVLELGVVAEATFVPGTELRVRVSAEGPTPLPISEEVAARMARGLRGTVSVRLRHELPIGQGFGMSAAGSLATALAVGELAHRPQADRIQTAHLADLFGGGGLGGVAAILGGGIEVRTRAGVPPWGRVEHRAFGPALLVGVVGRPIPSPSVLGSPESLRRILEASEGWERLGRSPTPAELFRRCERFTDRAGLATPAVERAISSLRRRGARACQAMFGQSFFALPRTPIARSRCLEWLQGEALHAVEIRAAPTGAHLLAPRTVATPPAGGGSDRRARRKPFSG